MRGIRKNHLSVQLSLAYLSHLPCWLVLGPQSWLPTAVLWFSIQCMIGSVWGHLVTTVWGGVHLASSEWRQSSTSQGSSPNRVSSTSASSWETCDVHLTVSFSYIKLLSDFSVRVKTRFFGPPWPASCFNTLMLLQLVTFSLSVPPYPILHMQKCFSVSLMVPGAEWVLLLLLLNCYFLVRFTLFQSKMCHSSHTFLYHQCLHFLSEDLTCVKIGCSICMPLMHITEKAMAPHSSVLAWRIPGMEEPGGLPSMGSHRVGHNQSDLAAAAAAMHIKSSMDVPSWCCSAVSLCLWWMQESCLREWSEQTLVLDCGFQSISSTNWRGWDCCPGSQVKISHVG